MEKKTKVVLSVGAVGAAAWVASRAIIHPTMRPEKKALRYDEPIIVQQIAHSTTQEKLAEAAEAVSLSIHGFAGDILLTADEEIILAATGSANSPVLLKDLLVRYPHLLFVVRLADSPDTYEGSLMPSKLWRLLKEYGAQDQVAVFSPYDEQVDRFNLYTQHRAAVGAGKDEIRQAYAAYSSGFGHLYQPRTDFFVLSGKTGPFQLANEGFIRFLKKLNVLVYIQHADEESIEKLAGSGVSGFITSSPDTIATHLGTLFEP